MLNKLIFTKKNPLIEAKFGKKNIFNFLNLYSLWLFNNNKLFQKSINSKNNLNFPDGKPIAKKLKILQERGPSFTRNFLQDDFARDKKHFFIGLEISEIERLSKVTKIPKKKIWAYNPPFIKEMEFSNKEKIKMIQKINNFKTDYLWICIGNPKQEILANQIFDSIKVNKIFNVGAALDFLLKRKKECPKILRNIGVESVYLGITNPKRAFKKIKKSFIGLKYLKGIKLE